MPKKPKLTAKQARLVKAKAEGKTHIQAYKEVYSATASDATAVSNTDKILKKEHIANALQLALENQGVTADSIVAPITEALNHDDLEMRLKGSDRAVKIVQPKGETPTNYIFGDVVNEQKNTYGI